MASLPEKATKFLELRTAGKNDELLAMCTDDVSIDHFKDGKINGKEAYAKYLKATPAPPGKWDAPTLADPKTVKITGTVKKMMMNWTVHADFNFNDAGLITFMKVYR